MPQFSKDELIAMAKAEATKQNVDPVLFCSVIETESSWFPYAMRFEPAFYDKYVAPRYTTRTTESIARATSFGLTQIMGESAREAGFNPAALSALLDPALNLEYGCKWLAGKLAKAKGDVNKALLLWNGGSDKQYPQRVLSKQSNYR